MSKVEDAFYCCSSNDITNLKLLVPSQVGLDKLLNGKSMMTVAIEHDSYECMQYLVDNKIDLEQSDRTGKTPIHVAVINNKKQALIMLLHNNCNPDIQDSDGFTPLHWAVQRKNLNFVEILIEFNANPNVCDYEGISSLANAKAMGLTDIIKALEKSKLPPPQKEGFGGCQIFGFCFGGQPEPEVLPSKGVLLP
jgi:ankyrin repeat protein